MWKVLPLKDSLLRMKRQSCVPACSVVPDSLRPVDCSLPGSSVCGSFRASLLERGATSSSRGSSRPWGGTASPALASQVDSSPLGHQGSPYIHTCIHKSFIIRLRALHLQFLTVLFYDCLNWREMLSFTKKM